MILSALPELTTVIAKDTRSYQGMQCYWFQWSFSFRFCKVRYRSDIIVAIHDIVHAVETTVSLC